MGHVLIRKLVDKGYFVNIIDPLIFGHHLYKEFVTHEKVEFHIGMAEDKYLLEKSLEGINTVIHLSGLSNDPSCELNEDLTKKMNVDATINLLKMSKDKGVERFLYASSCSVYGFTQGAVVNEESPLNPLTAYARSKVEGEEIIMKEATNSLIVTALRKATLYGPSKRMRFDLVINTMTGMAISEKRIIINGGRQWRPFLHVEDAADSYIFMLEADGKLINKQIFNVGCNEDNLQIVDVAHRVSKIIEGTEVITHPTEDERSYRVSFDKINNIGWRTKKTVEDGIYGVKKLFDDGEVTNFRDINYFNIKRMISYLNI